MEDEIEISANPGYALDQLARALLSGGQRAVARAEQWRKVIAGMLDGSLRVGERTPVQNTPAWVTLEVAHGGFATGALAASGPLQPHETEKLAILGASERLELNLHFAGPAGREEMLTLLRSGCYRINLPEEAALLIVAWLFGQGEMERARRVLEAITPFFDRLRFYPVPHARPLPRRAGISRWTVGQSLAALESQRPQTDLIRMKESITVWAPLYDRAVSLFLETVAGPMPYLGERRPDGQPSLHGGWPCRHFPDDWKTRAASLLADYAGARSEHALCGKPEKRKENFARLRDYLSYCIEDPKALSGRDVGQIRKILAGYLSRRGAPDSPELRALRQRQAADVAAPTRVQLAQVLARRLADLPDDDGSPEVTSRLGPTTPEEALELNGEAGQSFPATLLRRAEMSWEGPVEALVARGLVPSNESLADTLPALTARVQAEAIADPELSRVFEAVYRAFRRRRSLLLLHYQSQVKLSELPWIAVLEPWLEGGERARQDALQLLRRVATLALTSFPHTILPNKLVKELRALADRAGLDLPWVEELAADIFMGSFSPVFVRAAKVAAGLLGGSLYERYYGLSYERIAGLDDSTRSGPAQLKGLCRELIPSERPSGFSVTYNGMMIEQAQILTTHNLATIFGPLGIRPEAEGVLARQCFEQVCHLQSLRMNDWRARLHTVKDSAYAWRQMIFYLSLGGSDGFLPWARQHLSHQEEELRRRLEPAIAGLEAVHAGQSFDAVGHHAASGGRRLLGWTTERHWLLPAAESDH